MGNSIAIARFSAACLIALLLAGCHRQQNDMGHPAGSPGEHSQIRLDSEPVLPAPLPPSRTKRPPAVVFVEFVATPHDVVARMLELARVKADDMLYDLGCGDGRIVVAAAKKYGCRAIGYDLDPLRVAEARALAQRQGVADQVTIEQRDILAVDLADATVITIYLGTDLNARLLPRLKQLKPGTRIVSHNFGLEGIEPDKVVRMTSREDRREHLVYLWTCPLKEAGVVTP